MVKGAVVVGIGADQVKGVCDGAKSRLVFRINAVQQIYLYNSRIENSKQLRTMRE